MISYYGPQNHESCVDLNCTAASTFEKPKSLKFELLFGECEKKNHKDSNDNGIVNAVDYLFLPNSIFGFSIESFGADYQRFHYVFIVRACLPGEMGSVVPGISPGAEILVKTLTSAASERLKNIIKKLVENRINLLLIDLSYYIQLNRILETKMSTDYFVGELIAEAKNF